MGRGSGVGCRGGKRLAKENVDSLLTNERTNFSGQYYELVDALSLHSYYQELDDLPSFLASAMDMDRFIERVTQIADEVKFLMDFILGHYEAFGLTASLKFATRPETRLGDDAMWDRAEGALRSALDTFGWRRLGQLVGDVGRGPAAG